MNTQSLLDIKQFILSSFLDNITELEICNILNEDNCILFDGHKIWNEKILLDFCRFCSTLEDAIEEITPPSCTVVIICNNGRGLKACLDSVFNQSLPATEVIVVLDGCLDDSAAIASQYNARLISVKVHNKFLSHRIGFLNSTSDAICFLNSNHVLGADFLENTLPLFNSKVGLVSAVNQCPEVVVYSSQSLSDSQSFEDLRLVHDFEFFSEIQRKILKTKKIKRISPASYSCIEPKMHIHNDVPKIKLGYLGFSNKIGGANTVANCLMKYSKNIEWHKACFVNNDYKQSHSLLENSSIDDLAKNCDVVYSWQADIKKLSYIKEKYNKPIVCGVHLNGDYSRKYHHEIAPLIDLFWCVEQNCNKCIPVKLRHKIRNIDIGCDPIIHFDVLEKQLLIEKYQLPKDVKFIGYAGRFSYEKQLTRLAEAVNKIPNCVLFCLTDKSNLNFIRIKNEIYEILGNKLICCDHNEILLSEFYTIIDCFAITSSAETGPLVTMEAMLMNKPVVTTNVGFVSNEMKRHNELANVLPINFTNQELVDRLEESLNGRYNCLTTHAKEFVLYEKSIFKMVDDFEKTIEQVYKTHLGGS